MALVNSFPFVEYTTLNSSARDSNRGVYTSRTGLIKRSGTMGFGTRSFDNVGWVESIKGVTVMLSYQHYVNDWMREIQIGYPHRHLDPKYSEDTVPWSF